MIQLREHEKREFDLRRHAFKVLDVDSLPHKARYREKDIMNLCQFAYMEGFSLTNIDYKCGMLQFSIGKYKINFYTTKFTLVIVCKGNQESKKGLNKKRIKQILQRISQIEKS